MPPAGVIAVAALAAIGYIYVGQPVAHGVKAVGHAIGHTASKVMPHKQKKENPTP
ncbi:MAG: hypothetical protein LAP40_23460 [Acidobacteriia bacterium]|nr:hypothetical protein [Terriglobia bacterium]